MNTIKITFKDSTSETCTLVAVGDVMFARDVGEQACIKGIDSFFTECGIVLNDADVAFCNLETPVTDYNKPSPYSRSNFKTNPVFLKEIAKYFDVVSVANNHIYDFGSQGARDTVKHLKNSGIKVIGINSNEEDAKQPVIIQVGDIKIGLLAYTCLPTIDDYIKEYPIACFDEVIVRKDLESLKRDVDVCIVSLHGGHELVAYTAPPFVKMAHFAVDNGADLILGHHTHVIGGIEKYQGKPIIYSMGNFIFDNPTIPERRESFIIKANIDKTNGVTTLELVPVYINESYIPMIAEDALCDKILSRIGYLSECFLQNTNDELYWETASKGFLGNGQRNLSAHFKSLGIKGIWIMIKRLRPKHFKLLFRAVLGKYVK